LGPLVVRHYLAVKRFEWANYVAGSGCDPADVRVSEVHRLGLAREVAVERYGEAYHRWPLRASDV
jgi:hypothetical protein